MVKNPLANTGDARDTGSIPESGRSPGEGNCYPLQYSCLENPMDRSLAGYSPWGKKELDTTKQLTFSVFWLLDNWFVPSILINCLTENKFSASLHFSNLPAQ